MGDVLSRCFNMAISSPVFSILDDIKSVVGRDPELSQIMNNCIEKS